MSLTAKAGTGLLLTAIATAVAYAAGAETLVIAGIALAGLWILGFYLWWTDAEREKSWGDIGRGVMIAVIMAFVLGTFQDQLAAKLGERQQRQTFELSISTQKDMAGINLSGRNLAHFYLARKSFRDAELRDVNLAGANLRFANLSGADLTGANLTKANLRDVNFERANLENANLSGADLTSANLNEARLPGANLSRSGLVGASLRDACLTPSNLSQSHAEGADFTGAVLNRADVRGTRFEFDLRNARLEKTGLAGIKVDKSTHWPLDFKLREPPTTTLFTSFRTPIPADALTDKAVRFTDGDTLLAEKSGAIRLIGVDAPVLRDRLGRKAVEFMRNTLPEGQTFRYTLGRNRTDAFDRKLAYIWHADGRFVNAALLFLGLAERRENPVNDTYETKFRDAETIAKQIGRNIWNSCPRR